jgi:general secretion pathway protein L
MIDAFLAWWAQHLLAWLPARLRGTARLTDALVAEMLPGNGLALLARRGGREAALGSFAPGAAGEASLRAALAGRRGPLIARPSPGVLLARPVELPLAAERELGQVLRYEMDRLTPFAPDDLYWGWAVERRDRARGRLHVSLMLAPKAAVEPALAALRRAGARPSALEVAGTAHLIPLDPGRPRQERRLRQVLAAAAACCAVLALVAVGLPFALQSVASRKVERRIASLDPTVEETQALRRRIASGAAGAGVLAQQRAATGDALAVLATVTTLLPDTTYLSELTLHGRVLTLTGQSAAAAQLIPELSADPAIRDPAFIAPVTRNETARADQFSIRAELAP